MTKPFDDWTVLPHGKLVQIDDNLASVVGVIPMPTGDFQRRMTVVRLANGAGVIYSAIALGETEMSTLEAFVRPTWLVVPNDIHRLDARIWKNRYPELQVIAPAAARKKVEEIVPVDATTIDFGDPRVGCITVPGTGEQEVALLVTSRHGSTLVLNDLIFNMGHRPTVGGWLLELIGITGEEPHLPSIVRMREVKDKGALSAQLENWAHIPELRRIIVSHGKIIDHDATTILERVAGELAA